MSTHPDKVSGPDAEALTDVMMRLARCGGYLRQWAFRDLPDPELRVRQAADHAMNEIDGIYTVLGALRERIAAETERYDANQVAVLADVLGEEPR